MPKNSPFPKTANYEDLWRDAQKAGVPKEEFDRGIDLYLIPSGIEVIGRPTAMGPAMAEDAPVNDMATVSGFTNRISEMGRPDVQPQYQEQAYQDPSQGSYADQLDRQYFGSTGREELGDILQGVPESPDKVRQKLDYLPLGVRMGTGIAAGMSGLGIVGASTIAELAGIGADGAVSLMKDYLDIAEPDEPSLTKFIDAAKTEQTPAAKQMFLEKVSSAAKNIALDSAFSYGAGAAVSALPGLKSKARLIRDLTMEKAGVHVPERLSEFLSKAGEKLGFVKDVLNKGVLEPTYDQSRLGDDIVKLSDKWGIPVTLSNVGKSEAEVFFAKMPTTRAMIKDRSTKVVQALDKALDIATGNASGSAKTADDISIELADTLKSTIDDEFMKVLPIKDNIKKGYELGKSLKEGVNDFSKNRSKEYAALYSKAREAIPEGSSLVPKNTLSKIQEIKTRIPQGASTDLNQIESFINEMMTKSGGGVDPEQFKNLRVLTNGKFRNPTPGDAMDDKLTREILSAMKQDSTEFLKSLPTDAADAYSKADGVFQDTMDNLNKVASISKSEVADDAFNAAQSFEVERLEALRKILGESKPEAFDELRNQKLYRLFVDPKNPKEFNIINGIKNWNYMKETGYADVMFKDKPGMIKEYDRLASNLERLSKFNRVASDTRGEPLKQMMKLNKMDLSEFKKVITEKDPSLWTNTTSSYLRELGTDNGVYSPIKAAANWQTIRSSGLAEELFDEKTINNLDEIFKIVDNNRVHYSIDSGSIGDSYGNILMSIRGASTAAGLLTGNYLTAGLANAGLVLGSKSFSKLMNSEAYIRFLNSALEIPNPTKKQMGIVTGRLIGISASDPDLAAALRELFGNTQTAQERLFESLYPQGEQPARGELDLSNPR